VNADLSTRQRLKVLGTVLKLQGKISSGTLTMNSLMLEVIPVRVS